MAMVNSRTSTRERHHGSGQKAWGGQAGGLRFAAIVWSLPDVVRLTRGVVVVGYYAVAAYAMVAGNASDCEFPQWVGIAQALFRLMV